MFSQLKISSLLLKPVQSGRQFWWWVNMMFNRVDGERVKALGHDRCTAEWLLRNGSCVKFVSAPEPLCDYNLLPPENAKFFVQEIIAEDAGISHIGFPHIKGCTKLEKIVLKNCGYIEDEALECLKMRKDSLKHLELIDCKNLTDHGLRSLKELNLKTLVITNVPYVKDFDGIKAELTAALKGCDVKMEK
ncbi:ATP synthase subunit s, mitochondrial [Chironomus tepperi]|uniref:ATP synthase subunit s, mitochondrial n=1 Tax=Chironomus tepperi TaxID=113505 RepID=UPI00391EE848